jgi:hypothetical protein
MPLFSTACPLPINRKLFRHRVSVPLIPQTELALWLKADAGVTLSQTLYVTQVILTGFTGIYSGANGTYNRYYNNFIRDNGGYYIEDNNLLSNNGEIIATAPANYSGAWTPSNYISSVILTGAGTTAVNGTYTRTETQVEMNYVSFSASGSRTLTYDSGDNNFYTTNNEYAGEPSDLTLWSVDTGDSPAPTGSTGTSLRSVGSPTSTRTGVYPVTNWADQSGNGNNAIAYNNPILLSNELNSKPVISFNGYAQYASFPISLTIDTSRTIFIVGKYQDINRSQEGFIALGESGAFDLGYVFREAETGNTYYYNPSQVPAPADQDVGNYHIETVFNVYEDYSTMAFNGTFNGGVLMGTPEINEGLIATRNLLLNENAVVNIAEIIIYNKQLDGTEYDQVMTYLDDKYQIYAV